MNSSVVTDLEAALKFYVAALGVSVVETAPGLAVLTDGVSTWTLLDSKGFAKSFEIAVENGVARTVVHVRVADVQHAFDSLVSDGVIPSRVVLASEGQVEALLVRAPTSEFVIVSQLDELTNSDERFRSETLERLLHFGNRLL